MWVNPQSSCAEWHCRCEDFWPPVLFRLLSGRCFASIHLTCTQIISSSLSLYSGFLLVYRSAWAVPPALALQSHLLSSCLHLSPSAIHRSNPPSIHPLISIPSFFLSVPPSVMAESNINQLVPRWQLAGPDFHWVIHFAMIHRWIQMNPHYRRHRRLFTLAHTRICTEHFRANTHTHKHTHTHTHTHSLFSCINKAGSRSVRAPSLFFFSPHNQPMNFICSAPTALLSSSHSLSYEPTRTCTLHTYACAGAHPLLVCLICVDIDWYVFIVEEKVEGEGTDGWIGARFFKRMEQRGCLLVDNLSASKRSGTEGEGCLPITVRSPNWGNLGYGFCWGRGWLHEGGQHGPYALREGCFSEG